MLNQGMRANVMKTQTLPPNTSGVSTKAEWRRKVPKCLDAFTIGELFYLVGGLIKTRIA